MFLGLDKLAQIGETTEIDSPDKGLNNEDTTITCISDCIYSQNPEKTCMLKNVTLNMSKGGQFSCGQYSPLQDGNPDAERISSGRPTQEQTKEEKASGLDKVKQ